GGARCLPPGPVVLQLHPGRQPRQPAPVRERRLHRPPATPPLPPAAASTGAAPPAGQVSLYSLPATGICRAGESLFCDVAVALRIRGRHRRPRRPVRTGRRACLGVGGAPAARSAGVRRPAVVRGPRGPTAAAAALSGPAGPCLDAAPSRQQWPGAALDLETVPRRRGLGGG